MFDAAVAAGIAAFLAGDDRPPTDDEVRAALEARGVQRWLAERLVVFLPLAFGRVVLRDVSVSDEFLDGSVTRRLDGEPVYLAAAERAGAATRHEVERIGLRSSEVEAVNTALNNGSRLEDLMVGPPALPAPLPPAGPGDGGVPSPRDAYAALLDGHGFAVDRRGAPRVGELDFDARVFAQPAAAHVLAQVDFEARHPALAAGRIVESFAGFGATWKEAMGDAVVKFERSSLHPIIATLLDRTACRDQVEWERYDHPGGPFDLCLGPRLHLYSPGPPIPVAPVLQALLAALREVPLSREAHSLRIYACHRDGVLTAQDVLLDNHRCRPARRSSPGRGGRPGTAWSARGSSAC